MTVSAALLQAASAMRSQRIDAPELTARVLLGDVLKCDQAWLLAHSDESLVSNRQADFEAMVHARCEGVPLQYIRGVQEFYGREFSVSPDVLIPRPETEHLVEAALERVPRGGLVLDIGTGSGAVAVSVALERADTVISASDISVPALRVARANSERLGASVTFCAADIADGFLPGKFDAVLSNPPYVPLKDAGSLQRELRHEPSIALYGGEDGLEIMRRVTKEIPRVLKPGGWLLAEIGYSARAAVQQMLDGPAWEVPEFIPDLAGIDRVVVVRRSATSAAL